MVVCFLLQHSFEIVCGRNGVKDYTEAALQKQERNMTDGELSLLISGFEGKKSAINTTCIWLPLLGIGTLDALVYWQADGHPYVQGVVGLSSIWLAVTAGVTVYNKLKLNSQPEIPPNLAEFKKMSPDVENLIRTQGVIHFQQELGGTQAEVDHLRGGFQAPVEIANYDQASQQKWLQSCLSAPQPSERLQRGANILQGEVNNSEKAFIFSYAQACNQKAEEAQKVCELWNSTYEFMGVVTLYVGYVLVLSKIASTLSGQN